MADDAAKLIKFARRKKMNLEVIYVWFGVLLTMMLCFVFLNLVRKISSRHGDSAQKKAAETGPIRRPLRKLRVMTIKKAPGLPSSGHALVVFLYLALDIVCSFVHMDNNNFPFLTNFSSRNGWLAISNLVFVVFLAMKNTPLGFLSGWSYERLNILHQFAGYATVIHVIIHGSTYFVVFEQLGLLARFEDLNDACGIVAGLSFIVIAIAAILIRPWYYELFYIIHVSFWMVAVVTLAFHQPDLAMPFIYMTIVVASIWILDRTIRFLRLMAYSTNNSVSLTPLPHKATLVTMPKAPIGAAPGQHCFLWIPQLRRFETHPFTITSVSPLQFVVASYDGFTQELHQHAIENPGTPLRASAEGPYGSFPSPMKFNKIVLIAGGSGASFTFGIAKRILESKTNAHGPQSISLVWSVKQNSCLEWYATHLEDLKEDGRFNAHLYVTAQETATQQVALQAPDQEAATEKAAEKADESKVYVTELESTSPSSSSGWDSEKSPTSPTESLRRFKDVRPSTYHGYPVNYRRPDVNQLISSTVSNSSPYERVLVMVCGPTGMTKQVRRTVTKCVTSDGPQVELHCEQFGW